MPTTRNADAPAASKLVERRQPVALEAKDGGGRVVHLGHPGPLAADRVGEDRRRFGVEERTRGVDAIDPEVVERAAAGLALRPDASVDRSIGLFEGFSIAR